MSQAGMPEEPFVPDPASHDRRPYEIKAPDGAKPCPFCGGTDLVAFRETCAFMSAYECIRCLTCHANGPSKGFDDEWNHAFTWQYRNGIL